ncbi:DUF6538 domain-containing protein [Candidatus Methylocalor cossyra]|uniref:DUF6538 domain-containing protein n=1 Tax=Candidatus Methylocalor cossyra TaxID=3108543 RepID=UPI0032B15B9D
MSCVPAYITKNRHGTFYFRLIIPVRLRPYFPHHRRELKRSLGTDSRREAIQRARAYRVKFDRLFGELMKDKKDEDFQIDLITVVDLKLPNGVTVGKIEAN